MIIIPEDRKNRFLLKIDSDDNVETVIKEGGLEPGIVARDGIKIREHIPRGHKIAIKYLKKGEKIIKYGKVIGYATEDIPEGCWINEKKVTLPPPPSLEELSFGEEINEQSQLTGYTFSGYVNEDGSVGTKNMLGVVSCVQCVEGVVDKAVEEIENKLLPQFPHVDGIVPINHNYGCGVAIDAPTAKIPIRTLRNLSKNPNLGKIIIISLGCEKLHPDKLFQDADIADKLIILQEKYGFKAMVKTIISKVRDSLQHLNQRRREECSVSQLIVGLQCGGSDAFSGITANPAVGQAADMLVRAGATVMFSEVSEVRDGLHLLSPRIINTEVGEKLKKNIRWYDNYLAAGEVNRNANPTPGNKKGGLVNVVEKSLGSIEKSGNSPIVDVLAPGQRVQKRGLVFAATPASDFVCGTLQLSAGMNLQVFTTGRGTPYGLDMAPVIKVSTNNELMNKWEDLIDINAGRILTNEATQEEIGKEIFNLILDVASGNQKTKADFWGIKNRMCLFNPGPIT